MTRKQSGAPILVPATESDAPALAAFQSAVALDLTERFGRGHWSRAATERGALHRLRTTRVMVGRSGSAIVASFALATKKPWAIDRTCFIPVRRCLYLVNLAVAPGRQGEGLGRRCLDEAARIARDWPVEAIRLDAYDTAAGAGEFYLRCGYREVGRRVYRGTPLVYYELLLQPPVTGIPALTQPRR